MIVFLTMRIRWILQLQNMSIILILDIYFNFQVEIMINQNRLGCLRGRFTMDMDLLMDFALMSKKLWFHLLICKKRQSYILAMYLLIQHDSIFHFSGPFVAQFFFSITDSVLMIPSWTILECMITMWIRKLTCLSRLQENKHLR